MAFFFYIKACKKLFQSMLAFSVKMEITSNIVNENFITVCFFGILPLGKQMPPKFCICLCHELG